MKTVNPSKLAISLGYVNPDLQWPGKVVGQFKTPNNIIAIEFLLFDKKRSQHTLRTWKEDLLEQSSIDLKGHDSLADMVSTHINNWRDALTVMKETARPANREEGTDDPAYWEHELKALQDIENAINEIKKL